MRFPSKNLASALRGLVRRKLFLQDPIPTRYLLLRALDRRYGIVKSYQRKLDYGLVERAHYGHCMLHAAILARKLQHSRISCIEFGVAGGAGLIAMEQHAEAVRAETGVEIVVFGFDTGKGMPAPVDYRDLPYLWQSGYFAMDIPKLSGRLKIARLLLGDVAETLQDFTEREKPPPIGFIAFDLDYYSSTVTALKIFEANHRYLLPRVACYFDDMVGDIDWAYNEFTGELLAIKEFNAQHHDIKIAPVSGLRFSGRRIPQAWHEQIFVAHLFAHPDYRTPISELTQLPLDAN
ncbi:hypothetical protein I6F35_13120 [Bradyrhizobium sp. BRP22]|uniref:hypothetical protein n=1 Tax=Bradyrhizobium sp. BRP22 TaxID=2793821 RepID=UPI001CD35314|nr:hypothetical protein [Bradyrhizobium sp. BRP22]MCA1454150.1 hypothetical protein [Bradyrhizobium sp. BRP22]